MKLPPIPPVPPELRRAIRERENREQATRVGTIAILRLRIATVTQIIQARRGVVAQLQAQNDADELARDALCDELAQCGNGAGMNSSQAGSLGDGLAAGVDG